MPAYFSDVNGQGTLDRINKIVCQFTKLSLHDVEPACSTHKQVRIRNNILSITSNKLQL